MYTFAIFHRSTDSHNLADNAAEVRSQGITTYAVGVGAANLDELRVSDHILIEGLFFLQVYVLQIIATGDPESDERVYYVTDFSSLDQIADGLTTAIVGTGV